MDASTFNAPIVQSALWLVLAAAAVVLWLLMRERPTPRRFGGALACVVVALLVEALMPWLPGRAAGVAFVLSIAGPAFFGEMALLTGEPRTATVRAKGDTEVLVLERAGFAQLFSSHPSVATAVSRVLAMRQSELRERREQSVVSESPDSRARRLLARMQAIFRF